MWECYTQKNNKVSILKSKWIPIISIFSDMDHLATQNIMFFCIGCLWLLVVDDDADDDDDDGDDSHENVNTKTRREYNKMSKYIEGFWGPSCTQYTFLDQSCDSKNNFLRYYFLILLFSSLCLLLLLLAVFDLDVRSVSQLNYKWSTEERPHVTLAFFSSFLFVG